MIKKAEAKLRILEAIVNSGKNIEFLQESDLGPLSESFGLSIELPRDRSEFTARTMNILVEDLYNHVVMS